MTLEISKIKDAFLKAKIQIKLCLKREKKKKKNP